MTDGRHAEIEIKYAVAEDQQVPDLTTVPGIGRVDPVAPAELEAVYFDTPDRRLATARIALRRRRGGHDEGWHVKLPAEVGRTEVHGPLDPGAPDEVPAAVRDAVRSRVRDAALEPIARIVTTRTASLLSDAVGALRVEFVDDRVRSSDLTTGTARSWREWEAEQVGDDPEASARLLAALDPVLLASGARHSPSPSKLAQALGGMPETALPEPTTAGEALRRLIAAEVEQLHRDAFAVQHGGAEEVHAMRKTVRRLRALLALREVGGPAADRLRDRLRTVGATLGEAREATVRAEVAGRLLDGVDAAVPGVPEARRRLVGQAVDHAEAARRRALGAFATDGHLGLLEELERFTATVPTGTSALDEVAALPALARAAVRRAARRARHSDRSLPSLHRVRKAAKRARYLIEALDDATLLDGGSALRVLARRAEAVHDAIGEHRDLALLLADLPFAAARATAEGENAFVYGVLAERGGREAERLLKRAGKTMAKLDAAAN